MQRQVDLEIDEAIELAATKAAPLFNLFGWTWHDTSEHAPNANQIQNTLHRLMENATKYGETGTGRFNVRFQENEEDTLDLTISLELAHVFSVPKPKKEPGFHATEQEEHSCVICKGGVLR